MIRKLVIHSAVMSILAAGWIGFIDTTRWDDMDRWENVSRRIRMEDTMSVKTSTTTFHQDIESPLSQRGGGKK
jgi:hypothetical protein